MAHPIQISDSLLVEAQAAAAILGRTPESQIEFWASLGRSIERHLGSDAIYRLRATPPPKLSEILLSTNDPESRERLKSYLDSQPFPHFRPISAEPRLFERIDEDGTRTVGRIIGREFVPAQKVDDAKQ